MEISPVFEKYRIFRCSDCDPEYADEDSVGEIPTHAYEVILPVDDELVHEGARDESCPIESCPRCGSRLSMCADSFVRVERIAR